ncbi:MAG TPA: hypothetical protein VLA36_06555 [Longimicrobiales bacterium]|nr:hypothetical protein [Longimicrobiales bacterium]
MTSRTRFLSRVVRGVLALPLLACGDTPTSVELPDADVRILFVGNSLTAANNLPGLVATIAKSAGHSAEALGLVAPNYSLEEHWRSGLADRIRKEGPDVVIFQQGPTSLHESRVHLLAWADSFAPVVREAGGEPAFLMVWPEIQRVGAFDAVRENYRAAAVRAGGIFIPAGEAWRALVPGAGAGEPVLGPDPYGPDGFHPSEEGSLLAAYVTVAAIFGESVQGLPADMAPGDGRNPSIHLDPDVAALLQRLADEAVAAFPPRG